MEPREHSAKEAAATKRAKQYWYDSENTFLASTDYYDRVAHVLASEISPWINGLERAMDVGCGNGRFTFELAKQVKQIHASDLSPNLIAAAKAEASSMNADNITFGVMDLLSNFAESKKFDLVSCMGVLSTIVPDASMEDILTELVQRLDNKGYLLLRESLSETETQYMYDATPPAVYRSKLAYANKLAKHGMKPVCAVRMKSWPKTKRVNYLMLFRKSRFPFENISFRLLPGRLFQQALDRSS